MCDLKTLKSGKSTIFAKTPYVQSKNLPPPQKKIFYTDNIRASETNYMSGLLHVLNHQVGMFLQKKYFSKRIFSLNRPTGPIRSIWYPKPCLQHTRRSDGERSPKNYSSENKQSPRHGGEMLWKKTFLGSAFFPELEKKRSPQKVGTQHFPPMSVTLFFSDLKLLDSSLRHFLLYAEARVLDMVSWHVMAL